MADGTGGFGVYQAGTRVVVVLLRSLSILFSIRTQRHFSTETQVYLS
jgi:hypothetical protein